ncbi:hypothetical protein OUZ56_005274 [Daphnia magna]|uniref:MULE transposase domain-containing protein n=1 Tax=Daphnia magna TaxID=35525 RepID=A0ABQ9YSD0_9CRUS|nr:hypothetical protein OUZ56_005274 [Daphnia magna]
MASLLACFKCRLEIRVKQQKVESIDVTNHINDLQEYMDDLSSRNKISTNVTNDSVSEAVMPINAGIVCPNLSPAIPTCTNGFELDLTPPPPPYPSYNEILNDAQQRLNGIILQLFRHQEIVQHMMLYSKGPKSVTWRCTSRSKKIGCLAKVRQLKRDGPAQASDFTFLPHSEENPHNHPPNIKTAEVIDVRNEAKKEGLVHKFKPAKKICEERILKLQGSVPADSLPNLLNCVRQVNRCRESARPPAPAKDNPFFTIDLSGFPPNFYLGAVEVELVGVLCRHLLFATPLQLRHLANIKLWMGDGTFDIIALPFKQLWSIHDYEKALWKAVARVFPEVQHWGCSFHQIQAEMRRLKDKENLSVAYQTDPEIRRVVQLTLCLCYLHHSEIRQKKIGLEKTPTGKPRNGLSTTERRGQTTRRREQEKLLLAEDLVSYGNLNKNQCAAQKLKDERLSAEWGEYEKWRVLI